MMMDRFTSPVSAPLSATDTDSFATAGLNARLLASIRDFDRYMKNGYLDRVTLEEASYILDQIARFNLESGHNHRHQPHTGRLVAAGCRLASDLSAKIMDRMMDVLEESDQSLQAINGQVRTIMRNRYLSTTMLQKAQQVRQATSHAAESTGLGMIL